MRCARSRSTKPAASHACTYAEIKQAETEGELTGVAVGTTMWFHRTTDAPGAAMPGAAHNKVIIVDADRPKAAVITGSYNYTRAANARNAENVVIISGSPGLARRFVDNFDYHRALARALP